MSTLGERVRRLRKLRGLTIDGLVELSGISRSTISLIESGQRPRPGAHTIHALAKALKVSGDQLLGDTEPVELGDRDQLVESLRNEASNLERDNASAAEAITRLADLIESSEDYWIGYLRISRGLQEEPQ